MTSLVRACGRALRVAGDAVLRAQVRWAGIDVIATHSLVTTFLSPSSVIVDAGANRGSFSNTVIERFRCRVIALEPVAELAAQISPRDGLEIVECALSSNEGTVPFHSSPNPEAGSLDESLAEAAASNAVRDVETVTLDGLLNRFGLASVSLLKLDIEGSEIAVLESLSSSTLRAIDQITVEFHDFVVSAHRVQILALRRRLRREGFYDLALSSPWGYHADTLFLNRRSLPIDLLQRVNLALLSRATLPLRRGLQWLRDRAG